MRVQADHLRCEMKTAIFALFVLAACGSSEAPAAAPEPLPSASTTASASAPVPTSIYGTEMDLDAAAPATTASVPAALGRDAIKRTIHGKIGSIKRCYERALAQKPDLTGRVAVRFVVDASGNVTSAVSAPQSTMPDPDVVSCVLGIFRGLSFPPHDGGPTAILYPFDFQPSP